MSSALCRDFEHLGASSPSARTGRVRPKGRVTSTLAIAVRAASLLALFVTTALTASAQQEPGKAECLSQHERAQVLRMDGKLLEARAAMSICAQRSCQPAVVEDCIQWLPQLDRQIPSVVLAAKSDQGDETRVSVYVDDVLVAERLDGRPLDLDPGTYRIRFVWGTAKPIERAVLLREGEKYRQVIADFRSAPKVRPLAGGVSKQAPRRETRPVPGAVYVLGSVGAVAVATSAVMALSARSARTEALSSCAPLCEQTEVDSVRGKALAADIAGGIGLVSLGLAGYMYWTRPTVYEPVLAPSQSGWVFGLRGRY